jgi:hypothetical protein
MEFKGKLVIVNVVLIVKFAGIMLFNRERKASDKQIYTLLLQVYLVPCHMFHIIKVPQKYIVQIEAII